MTATTDFIAELYRAANEVDRVSISERDRLLRRAVTTIREMRELLLIPSSNTSNDKLIALGIASHRIEELTDRQTAASLLDAAGMIRDLRVVMDSKVEIMIKDAGLSGNRP